MRMEKKCQAFISAFVPRSENNKSVTNVFRNGLASCIESLVVKNQVVVFDDLNTPVRYREKIQRVLVAGTEYQVKLKVIKYYYAEDSGTKHIFQKKKALQQVYIGKSEF